MADVHEYLLAADTKKQLHALLDAIESGDTDKGADLLDGLCAGFTEARQPDAGRLSEEHKQNLYQSVGQLTRDLHESLKNFGSGAGFSALTEVDLPDARARLRYVIEKTNEAANKTMDKIEIAVPLADALRVESSELLTQWEKIARREMSGAEFREIFKHVFSFLQEIQIKTEKIHCLLSEIVLAQDFQDLTGQVLTKVIHLVTNLEDNLLKLITLHDQPGLEWKQKPPAASGIAAEGPQIHAQKKTGVVSGQDEVDALLSSLGF